MASEPKEQHCYLVHNFAEFEALARRALHEGEGRKKALDSSGLSTGFLTEKNFSFTSKMIHLTFKLSFKLLEQL